MGNSLSNWEVTFESALQRVKIAERQKAGALLPVIPEHAGWDEFIGAVKEQWVPWQGDLKRYSVCIIVLYGGLAFYEYDERTFWPHLAKAVGVESIPPNKQTEINGVFSQVAEQLGFPIQRKFSTGTVETVGLELSDQDTTTSYVGSAVYHIGIPLSLWDGFLKICYWAGWQDGWKELSDNEWAESIGRRTSGQARLKKFLLDNRERASFFIQEMIDAREALKKDTNLTINDLVHACFLRSEYFDEVPETSDFLRPKDSESLVRDRAQLIWDEQRERIVLYLPGVHQNKLPATWHLDHFRQSASRSPDELILNSLAFQPALNLKLVSGNATDSQRLRGVSPWGLFDLDRGGRFQNPDREYLPLHSYALVSPAQLPNITNEGFEETERPANPRFELSDGTQCYVTHLWPTGKFAELIIEDHGQQSTIRFRRNSEIEARFFAGDGSHAANFARLPHDEVKIEDWPILCLAIPRGYYKDNQIVLDDKFKVLIDGKRTFGRWKKRDVHLDDEKDFYVWNWSQQPRNYEKIKSGTIKSFKQLPNFFRPPVSHGKMILSIQAPGFSKEYRIYKDTPKTGMDKCWKHLPGAFLPWFLLCQTQDGMKWDELLFSRDVIAPALRLSAPLLRKYEKGGFFVHKGVRWMIAESRATVTVAENEQCQLDYCGDPSVLWRLYRWMSERVISLPDVTVINKRGELPYLRMIWDACLNDEISYRLHHMNVRMGSSLWNH